MQIAGNVVDLLNFETGRLQVREERARLYSCALKVGGGEFNEYYDLRIGIDGLAHAAEDERLSAFGINFDDVYRGAIKDEIEGHGVNRYTRIAAVAEQRIVSGIAVKDGKLSNADNIRNSFRMKLD